MREINHVIDDAVEEIEGVIRSFTSSSLNAQAIVPLCVRVGTLLAVGVILDDDETPELAKPRLLRMIREVQNASLARITGCPTALSCAEPSAVES